MSSKLDHLYTFCFKKQTQNFEKDGKGSSSRDL